MLSRRIFYLFGLVVLSVMTFFITRIIVIHKAPIAVMSNIENRIAGAAGGWNKCFHNQTYGPRKNSARRANPDSIISSMAYDLSEGPVRIKGMTWPRYWSISFYQQNSDNFFVLNDLNLASDAFEIILALDNQDVSSYEGVPIMSPSTKGIMLIRRFAADASDMDGILANQAELICSVA